MLPLSINLKAPLFYTILFSSKFQFPIGHWSEIIKQIKPFAETVIIAATDNNIPDCKIIELGKLINDENIPFYLETKASWENPSQFLDDCMRFSYLRALRICYPATKEEDFSTDNIRFAIHSGIQVYTLTNLNEFIAPNIDKVVKNAKKLGVKKSIFAINPFMQLEESSLISALLTLKKLENDRYNVQLEGEIPQCFYHNKGKYREGEISCCIYPTGEVSVCRYGHVILGSLRIDPIEKLWSGKNLHRFKKSIPKKCKKCSMLGTCPIECGANNPSLIKGPLNAATEPQSINISLDELLIPHPCFKLQKERFGGVLIKDFNIEFISKEGYAVASGINGKNTLKQLNEIFGADAISFLYDLYEKQLIFFKNSQKR